MADIMGIGFLPDEKAYGNCGGRNSDTAKTNRTCGKLYIKSEEKRMTEHNGADGIYKDINFDDFIIDTHRQRQARTAAQKYAYYIPSILKGNTKGKKHLFLYGSPGTGKTTLAAIIINVLSKQGLPCKLIKMGDLLSEIKDTFKSNDITEREVLEPYKTIKVLAIDDLGQEKSSKWSNEKMFNLIDYRCSHGLATIFTTNYSPDALEERLIPSDAPYDRKQAEAIRSRILGSAEKVPMYWDDYRYKEDA